ncbi:hypothetical protein MBM_05706 [Drepanopeziza brunnea f. sp. 'multigermtubi' MB_m1]|uniref:tRNA modification GTPase TrmE n=1 Tax=Marssonina brunnea f. sp. multigermtubi (strain MB_m1) TaxID=1072389 RepID=K1WVB7_MARBU|nr:uncharacterized protein MBM_05706 [Drepanopeziza brunnea f. sp. 'multigermtubi' MB_m1]EKD16412.1 hypothetical protein MBM_05706 [Drepanopeziza brunnea f. sp. 'multigermtubi' MB_m1]
MWENVVDTFARIPATPRPSMIRNASARNARRYASRIFSDTDKRWQHFPVFSRNLTPRKSRPNVPRVPKSPQYFAKCFHSTALDRSDGTVYALSTGSGGAIAIVRISGPGCDQIYHALCPARPLPRPRNVAVRTLCEPGNPANVLDADAVVLRFTAPKSSTGEDMLELHIHGGAATVKAVMSAIAQIDSRTIRAAGPGEFTRRSFANGKLDLAQIEALGDTLAAQTEQQRRAALRGRSGELSRVYQDLQADLQLQRAQLAADVDFGESEDLEGLEEVWSGVVEEILLIQARIIEHQSAARCGEMIRRGVQVSLIGFPNVGKSSLFNRILGTQASIVNQQAGTTRDIVEATVDIKGYLCTIADTAGVRSEAEDIGEIEEEGIRSVMFPELHDIQKHANLRRRAIAKAETADMIVFVLSPDQMSQDHAALWSIVAGGGAQKPAIVVLNKAETLGESDLAECLRILERSKVRYLPEPNVVPILPISALQTPSATKVATNPGNIATFLSTLTDHLQKMTSVPIEMQDLIGATERQRQLLQRCHEHLDSFITYARHGGGDAAIAIHHLDNAANCLTQITGRDTMGCVGDVEEILGVVFERFCVGK